MQTKAQDDMTAADGVNYKKQLLPAPEGKDKPLSSDRSYVMGTTHSHADHRGTSKREQDSTHSIVSVPQRNKWVEAEAEGSRPKSSDRSYVMSTTHSHADHMGTSKREQDPPHSIACVPPRNKWAEAEAEVISRLKKKNGALEGQLKREQAKSRGDIANMESWLKEGDAKIRQLMDYCRNLEEWLKVRDDEINQLRNSNKRLETLELALKNDLDNLRNDLGDLETAYSKISESGSSQENSATATDASEAFTRLSHAVDLFSKQLGKFLLGRPDKMEEFYRSHGDVTFLQSSFQSLALILRAEVMSVLFEGFENESFNLEGGYCVYPDPEKRKKEFFALFIDFRNNKRGPGYDSKGEQDDQFVKYHGRSKTRVWQLFGLESSEDGQESLEFAFTKAALSVWASHLLSFSFEPPASLFRVRNGAEFDRAYMVTPGFLEFDEDLLEKVEFMLTPGLRVDKFQTIKSEIYPVHIAHVEK